MIVVVGQPLYRATEDRVAADGLAARIALAAAAQDRTVQLVGKAGEDPEGDAVVLALARGGVGHVAFLRDAGTKTPRRAETAQLADDDEARDYDLGLAGEAPSAGDFGREPVLDAADVELALRYLTDFGVIVLTDPVKPDVARIVSEAASWAGARMIAVVSAGAVAPDGLPTDAIVFEAPDADPDGVFATFVGSFAAALDDGSDPATAFKASAVEGGWRPSADA
jgi:hypothetical protein